MYVEHKNCGGEIEEDWTTTYEYEGSKISSFRCKLCREEILGNRDVEIYYLDEGPYEVPGKSKI